MDSRAVAVGECGLDFDRNFSPPQVQEQWFEGSVETCLRASDAAVPSLSGRLSRASCVSCPAMRPRARLCIVLRGRQASLKAYLEAGYYIGITGWICDPRRGRSLQELVRLIPLDRLMLETDAPFLPPWDVAGLKRNQPAWLPHIARRVAACLDVTEPDLVAATTRTAASFFLGEGRC